MKYLIIKFSLLFLLISCKSHAQDTSQIQWVDFEDAIEMQAKTPKKIFLFVYTDWCDFCKYTKETLLTYQPFIDAVNNQFIPVKFNAEQTETVNFMDHELGIQEESGYHYLPIIFMDGNMEFPGFIFLNQDAVVISNDSGVKEDVKEFTDYVNYIGSDAYLTQTWMDYTPE